MPPPPGTIRRLKASASSVTASARSPGSTQLVVVGDGAEHEHVASPRISRKRSRSTRRDLDHEATLRFGEQRRGDVGVGERGDGDAEPAGDAHLGQRHGQPALADVVAGLDETVADRPVQAAVALRRGGIGRRHDTGLIGRAPATRSRVTPGELGSGRAEQDARRCPARLSTGVTQRSASGTWATAVITSVGGTEWRSPSAPVYSLLSESLPGHERCPVGVGGGDAAVDGGDQLAEGRSRAAGRPTRSCRAGRRGRGRHRRRRRCGSPRRRRRTPSVSGSCRPYHGLTPIPIAIPSVALGSASTTPSAGASPRRPTSGRTTVAPRISWS